MIGKKNIPNQNTIESNSIIENDNSFINDNIDNKIETQDKTNDKTEILNNKKIEENTGTNSYISEIQISKNNKLEKNKNEDIKEEINSICLNIFLNYSKFYYEEKDFLLCYQTLVKIFKEGNIIDQDNHSRNLKKNNSKNIFNSLTSLNSNYTLYKKKKNSFSSSNLEILIKEISPKKITKITSTQFLNIIALISKKKFPKEFNNNPKNAVIIFSEKYLKPINEKIENDETDKFQYKIIESSINDFNQQFLDKGSEILLINLYEAINWIYITYFKQEINFKDKNIKKSIKLSLESLVNFSKDYDICPSLISIEKIAIYYNCLLDKNLNEIFEEDLGNIFTFNKFCLFLIILSNNIYRKSSNKLWERFVFLIKKMINSKGHEKISVKLNIKIPEEKKLKITNLLISEIIKLEETEIYNTKITELKTEEDNDEDEDKLIFKNIYDLYSNIGDKLIIPQMTVSSFLKALRDLGVFNIYKDYNYNDMNLYQNSIINLSHTDYQFTLDSNRSIKKKLFSEKDAQMIYFKVCNKKNINYENINFDDIEDYNIYNKINFEQFYIIMQEIANFIHNNLKQRDAFKEFKYVDLKIQNYKNSLNNELEQIKYLLNVLRNDSNDKILRNLKEIFSYIQNILYEIFMMYSINNLLNFNQFFLIFKDFDIFPNIISLIEMKKLFFCLSKISNEENKKKKGNLLEFEYFMCSLGLCSKFRKDGENNINDCQKLASILYVMRNSKGISNPRKLINGGKLISIDKELINILSFLHKKFPEYFNGRDNKKLLSYDNLFNDIFND